MLDFGRRQFPTRLLVAVVLVAAAGFAAIGATAQASTATTTIGSRDTKADAILVGPRGQTLYSFNRDQGGTSSCYGRCARNWPPLRASGGRSRCWAPASSSSGCRRRDATTAACR